MVASCFVPASRREIAPRPWRPPFLPEEIAFTWPVGCGGVVASLKGVVWSMMGSVELDGSVVGWERCWMGALWDVDGVVERWNGG